MSDAERTVIVEVTIAAPVDQVWEALRDPEQIRRWHGWEFDGLDDEIRVIYIDGTEPDEEAHRLHFTGIETRFELDEQGPGRTRLRVTKPAPAGDEPWDAFYDEIDQGWITFVQQLAFALEEHPGEERRTLHFAGAARAGGGPLTAGVIGVEAAAPGERFHATTPWGDELSGSVRYRARHQVGLVVDQLGNGLLVLHAQPASATPPHGGGRAILTLYGLDGAERGALAERWAAWMERAYPEGEAAG